MNLSQRNLLYNQDGLPASPFRTDNWPLFDPAVRVEKPEKTDESRDAKMNFKDYEHPRMTR